MNLLRRSPWLWLLLAWLFATTHGLATHGFRATIEPDSETYLNFDWSSPAAALSNLRTCGYPLFLSLVTSLSSRSSAVPVAHWLAWLAVDWLLYRGLVRAGYRPFVAVWAAAALLLGHAAQTFTPVVLADSLASSLSVAAAGCFLGTTSCACLRRDWIGLTVTTFLAYQVRPAFLFLIPLWPVLWVVFGTSRLSEAMSRRTRWVRGGRYVAAGIIPFLTFCAVRWAIVGHFGLVSFGGYNLIGVVGQFPDADSIESLPADLQPLATDMLRRRDALPDAEPPSDYLAMERMFNPTVWQAAVPAARDAARGDAVQVNSLLTRLSRALLAGHGADYLQWLAWNGKHAVKQTVLLLMTDRGVQFLALGFLVLHATSLWRGPSRVATGDGAGGANLEPQLLFWTAVGFTAAKTLLVILVEPAIGRYMIAATVLLPAATAVPVARAAWQWLPPAAGVEQPSSSTCRVS